MRESGYYPPGAEFDVSAPWNICENPEKDFDVTVVQSLSKPVTLVTTNYELMDDPEDRCYSVDTSDTNWKEEYEEYNHTPIQLIEILKKILSENLEKGIALFGNSRQTKCLIDDCEDWCVDDYEIVEN